MKKSLIQWIEIPAYDFDKAVLFYSSVFNLKIEKKIFNGVLHGVFSIYENNITGAIVKVEGMPTSKDGVVLYFNVYEMTVTENRIVQFGGTILKEKAIIKNSLPDGSSLIPQTMIDGEVGYYSLFRDTEGNKMGLYSNS